jgi:hypothetical protein
MWNRLDVLLCLALASTGARAQESLPFRLSPELLRVPLHEEGEARELWAMGDGYKLQVGERVVFHPRLAAPSPWAWTTLGARVGEHELVSGEKLVRSHDAWRVELERGAFREIYELGAANVEQSFLFEELPDRSGPLVVRGRVESALRAEPREAAHGELAFLDERGELGVRYGAAFAIDAAGSTWPMSTRLDGEVIELSLAAEHVACARLPLLVDPVLSGGVVTNANGDIFDLDVVSSTRGSGRSLLVAFTYRWTYAYDTDVLAYACQNDFTQPAQVVSRIDTSYNDIATCAAAVPAVNRWITAWERRWSTSSGTTQRTVQLEFHDFGSTTLNGGVSWGLPSFFGPYEQKHSPRLGGCSPDGSSDQALLVYGTDRANGAVDIATVRLDARNRVFATQAVTISATAPVPGGLHHFDAAVNETGASGGSGWLVAYEVGHSVSTSSEIRGALFDAQGQRIAESLLVARPVSGATHDARIAGADGVFAMTYFWSDGSNGIELRAQRIDWPALQPAPSFGPARTLATDTSENTWLAAGDLAFDRRTGSHWCASWSRSQRIGFPVPSRISSNRYALLGASCAPLETGSLPSSDEGITSALSFDRWQRRFACAVHTLLSTGAELVEGGFVSYDAAAQSVAYGSACGTASISSELPYAGNGRFAVHLSGASNAGLAFFQVAALAGSLPLDPFGAPSCTYLLDPNLVLVSLGASVAQGRASMPLPLPDDPAFRGDFYVQWFPIVPAANALGLQATRALEVRVR